MPPEGKSWSVPGRAAAKGWPWHLGLLLAATLAAYWPALDGPFVFDDAYLPVNQPEFADRPLSVWISGVRPLLMASYWVNDQISGADPYGFHVFNVLLHLATGLLVFCITGRILQWAGVADWPRIPLALFTAGMFLLHPLQTESVAYVAGRSEALSAFFSCAAFATFLYRRSAAISFPVSAAVLLLCAGALLSKEHAVVLPALLLLTDYFWNPGFSLRGIRSNWRLYASLGVLGLFGLWRAWGVLASADTAGFALGDLPWPHYFWTQCRALWVYLRLFVLPLGQSADHAFPISRSLLDHGAALGLAALLACVLAAWQLRRRFPLAGYGFLVFLLMLAPTSSVVPIQDALVERRVYLPSVGLSLVAAEFLRRWNPQPRILVAVLAGVLALAGVLTHQRSRLWSNPIALWEDTVARSPGNARAHFQLAFAYYQEQRCDDALLHYGRVGELEAPDHRLLVDWALASDCAGRPDDALTKLERAAALEATGHVYSLIGMIHAKQGRYAQALDALETAAALDPRFPMTYVYRGNVYLITGQPAKAAAEYRRALELDGSLQTARDGLALIHARPLQDP